MTRLSLGLNPQSVGLQMPLAVNPKQCIAHVPHPRKRTLTKQRDASPTPIPFKPLFDEIPEWYHASVRRMSKKRRAAPPRPGPKYWSICVGVAAASSEIISNVTKGDPYGQLSACSS